MIIFEIVFYKIIITFLGLPYLGISVSGNAEKNSDSKMRKWENLPFVSHSTGELYSMYFGLTTASQELQFYASMEAFGQRVQEVHASLAEGLVEKG